MKNMKKSRNSVPRGDEEGTYTKEFRESLARGNDDIARGRVVEHSVLIKTLGSSSLNPVGGSMKLGYITLVILTVLFAIFAFVFTNISLGPAIWFILALAGLGWFVIELSFHKFDSSLAKKALLIGLFLMLFDFMVENAGWILGYWHTQNGIITIGTVPIGVMLICLLGGAGWALYLPKKFDLKFSLLDSLFFAFWGALGEYVLSTQGLMVYTNGWTSVYAFLAYFITWEFLHWARYHSPIKMS